jgi:hypothetical protein
MWIEQNVAPPTAELEIAPTPMTAKRTTRSSMRAMAQAGGQENMPPPSSRTTRSRSTLSTSQQLVPNTPMGLKTPAFDPRLPFTPAGGESKRLVIEPPWLQFTSECQRC